MSIKPLGSLDERFARLPRYAKREFVPDQADLTKAEEVTALYRTLLDQPITSAADLRLWLKQRSELETVMDQAGSLLYIKMSCQTDHEPYSKAYEDFIQNVVPVVEPLADEANKKYLEACSRLKWNDPEFEIYTREIRTDVELFQEKNVPLQTEIQMLSQEYQKITGAMMIHYQDKELTLPQAGQYLEEPDRTVREEVWRLTAQRRLQDAQKLDDLFDKMLKLRHQIALNAGFENFIGYKFKSMHRFDYGPENCRQYHASVKEFLVPLWKKILQRRQQQMKVGVLRPWDTAADPLGRPPLKPFSESADLIRGCKRIFQQIDPELGEQFCDMADLGLLDLDSRKGKAPGGYQSALSEARKPFIFMNAVGTDDDIRTLLHEGGHAFHTFAAADYFLPAYRHAPMEFCEVASMTMELFADDFLEEFYEEEEQNRSVTEHLEGIVYVLIWVAIVDSFQHWIYQNPQHTQEERKQAWLKIQDDFGAGVVSWDGLEQERAYLWHRQLHVFEVPFYYIEYGIAQLGALQLWLNSKKDFKGTVQAYRRALALGGSQSLPKLFESAGLTFDFSGRVLQPLAESLQKTLE